MLNTQQDRIPEHVSGMVNTEEEQVNENQEHPDGEYPVRNALVLLADQQEFNEDGDTDTRDVEDVHWSQAFLIKCSNATASGAPPRSHTDPGLRV